MNFPPATWHFPETVLNIIVLIVKTFLHGKSESQNKFAQIWRLCVYQGHNLEIKLSEHYSLPTAGSRARHSMEIMPSSKARSIRFWGGEGVVGVWHLASILYSIISVKPELKLTTNTFAVTAKGSKQNQNLFRFGQLAPLPFMRPKGVKSKEGTGWFLWPPVDTLLFWSN